MPRFRFGLLTHNKIPVQVISFSERLKRMNLPDKRLSSSCIPERDLVLSALCFETLSISCRVPTGRTNWPLTHYPNKVARVFISNCLPQPCALLCSYGVANGSVVALVRICLASARTNCSHVANINKQISISSSH